MKEIIYKGYTISIHLTGWYSSYTSIGLLKSDTLAGIKSIIKNLN